MSILSRLCLKDEHRFENNVASESGGAFFIKCTDIVANRTTFVQNKAKGSGGAIYAEDVFNIVLLDSSLDGNTAGNHISSSMKINDIPR